MARLVSIPWHRALEEPLRSALVPPHFLSRKLLVQNRICRSCLWPEPLVSPLFSCAKFGFQLTQLSSVGKNLRLVDFCQ